MENKSKLQKLGSLFGNSHCSFDRNGVVLISNRPTKTYNYSEIVGYFEDQKSYRIFPGSGFGGNEHYPERKEQGWWANNPLLHGAQRGLAFGGD